MYKIKKLQYQKAKKLGVEIKPSKQTKPPQTKYRKKQHLIYEQKQYITNQAKWKAAKQWADDHGYKFLILTERELFSGKSAKR